MPYFTFKFSTVCVSVLPLWGQKCGEIGNSFFTIMRVVFGQKRSSTVKPLTIFTRFKPPTVSLFQKLELKGDHYALIKDIQKSVTTKLKLFPISDFAWAIKQFEGQETNSNKYYLFEYFAFFSPFSQHCCKTYQTHLVYLYMYKNAWYRSQFWTNLHEIYMVGGSLLMGEPCCFLKQFPKWTTDMGGKCARKTSFLGLSQTVWCFSLKYYTALQWESSITLGLNVPENTNNYFGNCFKRNFSILKFHSSALYYLKNGNSSEPSSFTSGEYTDIRPLIFL